MSNMDALLNAAGIESSDEDERVEMNDTMHSRSDAGSTQSAGGDDGTTSNHARSSILDKYGDDDLMPASQGSNQTDGTQEVLSFEKPKEPKLQKTGVEYTKRSGTTTLLKALANHEDVFEHNAQIAHGLWDELNRVVKRAQAQEKTLKKANEKASKSRSFEHEARNAKSELATSISAWKTEKANLMAQIKASNDSKKILQESLNDTKETLKETKAELAALKNTDRAEKSELIALKKRKGELKVQVDSLVAKVDSAMEQKEFYKKEAENAKGEASRLRQKIDTRQAKAKDEEDKINKANSKKDNQFVRVATGAGYQSGSSVVLPSMMRGNTFDSDADEESPRKKKATKKKKPTKYRKRKAPVKKKRKRIVESSSSSSEEETSTSESEDESSSEDKSISEEDDRRHKKKKKKLSAKKSTKKKKTKITTTNTTLSSPASSPVARSRTARRVSTNEEGNHERHGHSSISTATNRNNGNNKRDSVGNPRSEDEIVNDASQHDQDDRNGLNHYLDVYHSP